MDKGLNPYASPRPEPVRTTGLQVRIYQLYGSVAGVYQRLHTIRVNGVLLDTWFVVLLPIVGLFAWAFAVSEGWLVAWLVLACSVVAVMALVLCRIHHGIVFRATREVAPIDDGNTAVATEPPEFRASGRFMLRQGDRTRWQQMMDRLMSGTRGDQWFLEVPATFVVKGKLFAITAFLDPSIRFMGIRMENKAGRWEIDGLADSVQRPEFGVLHLGSDSRPAIRLGFGSPGGKSRKVVLTFSDEDKRNSFLHFMKSVFESPSGAEAVSGVDTPEAL